MTAFMCETKPYKAKFLSEAFPSVPIVFEDMCELWKGKGRDWLTKKILDVPKVSQPVYILYSFNVNSDTFSFAHLRHSHFSWFRCASSVSRAQK